MSWAVTGGLITGGSAMLLLAWLAARLLRFRRLPGSDPGGDADEFSAARYEPMARLVTPGDLAFLESLPGYRREIGAKLRRDRSRVFRMYLRELAHDFHRLHANARKLAAESPEPHAGLVSVLIRQQVRFLWAMGLIELRLLVPGAQLPRINVDGLVASIEGMRLDLSRITAPAL